MLYPTAPHLSQMQQTPRVGPPCWPAMWQMNKPENIDFFTVFKYNFTIYSVCKCIKKNKQKNIPTDYIACSSFIIDKQPQQNCNGRPLPTHKCHNQKDIPETAPFDLTILFVRQAFTVESVSGLLLSCDKKKKKMAATTHSHHLQGYSTD